MKLIIEFEEDDHDRLVNLLTASDWMEDVSEKLHRLNEYLENIQSVAVGDAYMNVKPIKKFFDEEFKDYI